MVPAAAASVSMGLVGSRRVMIRRLTDFSRSIALPGSLPKSAMVGSF